MQILYVDDDPAMGDIVKQFLQRFENFTVQVENSAESGLKQLQDSKFDAVISDYQMPKMNGIEFLKAIRASNSSIPFIIFTGRGREEVVVQAFHNGADFYLQKGGDPRAQFIELVHKINQAVRRREAEELLKIRHEELQASYSQLAATEEQLRLNFEELARSEKALRQSEEYYRTLFENTGTALLLIEEDTTIRLVNEQFCQLAGYTKEEIEERKHWTDFVLEEDEPLLLLQHYLRREKPVAAKSSYDFRFINRNGEIRIIFLSVSMVPGSTRSIASLIDVTDRNALAVSLQESEERYRFLYDENPFMYFTVDSGGIVRSVNPYGAEQLGYTIPELLGRPVLSVFHQDDKEDVQRHLDQCVALPGELQEWESRKVKKDGTVIWVREVARSVYRPAGEPVILVVCEDITDTKQMKMALQERELRYRSFFDTSLDCVFITSPEGDLIDFNNAALQLFRYADKEDLQKMNVKELFENPEERNRHIECIRQQGYSKEYPINLKKKDGTIVHALVTTVPIKGPDGTIACFQGTVHDITERKRREDALRQANRQLNLLTGVTRHDILNKVTVALGYLAILEKQTFPEETTRILNKIDSAVTRIRDDIEFTRIYQEIGMQQPQWIRIADYIPFCGIPPSVSFFHSIPPVEIFADPMLKKVFMNLLDNSAAHGERVTSIHFTGYETADGFLVIWEDDGVGIPAGEKEKIFYRGYGRHTGFGLYFAREILSITGITIQETGEPGTGARFEILIPKGVYQVKGS